MSEELELVDLGDARLETRQFYWPPWIADSIYHIGYYDWG